MQLMKFCWLLKRLISFWLWYIFRFNNIGFSLFTSILAMKYIRIKGIWHIKKITRVTPGAWDSGRRRDKWATNRIDSSLGETHGAHDKTWTIKLTYKNFGSNEAR